MCQRDCAEAVHFERGAIVTIASTNSVVSLCVEDNFSSVTSCVLGGDVKNRYTVSARCVVVMIRSSFDPALCGCGCSALYI